MVYLGTYKIKDLNTVLFTPEEYFTNYYVEEVYESEQVHTYTEHLRTALYAKYKNAYLNKAIKKSQHIIEEQLNEFLKFLQKCKELFDGTLGTWKTYPAYL